MDDRPPEMYMRCECAVVAVYIVLASTCHLLRLATDFPFFVLLPSFLYFKYPLFRFSHHLSFCSVLQGYLLEMQVTRLTGTEAVVSWGTTEKRPSAGENAEEKWTRVTSMWRLLQRVSPLKFPQRVHVQRVID